jgi:outer membrane autotransporter protein
LADVLRQLSGEAGTGTAQAGTQAMNSFLSQLTSPFPDSNRATPENQPAAPMVTKGPLVNKAPPLGSVADPRRWGIWAAGYGGQATAAGDFFGAGSHDRSVSFYGYASGLDYRVSPSTVVGFALAGGGTRFGLSENLGNGRSDMFQAAVYGATHFNAAYVSAAVAYAWHQVSTERFLNVLGSDHLAADFSAYNIGGRIEGGYRFALPGVAGWPGRYGLTPYAAGQVQAFHTPAYTETAVSGSSAFALAYDARTTTTIRSELGVWLDWSSPVDHNTALVVRTRAAWAHDEWTTPSIAARFQSLPGTARLIVTGAEPASDLLLASAGAEILFRNGFSLGARFDGEFAERSQKYAGTGRLRYTW